jgi:hypothetical protein
MSRVPERVLHVHFADAGPNGEQGVRISIIDFNHVISRLPENAVLIPEVTGGHLNHNEGLIIAFNNIQKLLFK